MSENPDIPLSDSEMIVAAITSNQANDDEQLCFKCGHTFDDHEIAGAGGANKCHGCVKNNAWPSRRHLFAQFPEGWGQ